MAALKAKIQQDLNNALKAKKEIEVSALRMFLAATSNRETEKRTKIWKEKPELAPEDLEKESRLTDDELLGVVSSEIKKRKEALLLFEKGKREDLVKKEKAEMEILENNLPEQLPEEEIRKLAKEAIEKVGAKDIKEMGKVMAELMPKIKGKADGGLVGKMVRKLLS